MQGYALNTQRLQSQQEQIKQLERTLTLFQQNLIEQASLTEARGLAQVIADYTRTFVLLNQFDSERLPTTDFNTTIRYEIRRAEAEAGVAALKADLMAREEASELFGHQKDGNFAGILGNIYNRLAANFCTQASRNRRRTCCILLLKTTHSATAISVSGRFCLYGFCGATASPQGGRRA